MHADLSWGILALMFLATAALAGAIGWAWDDRNRLRQRMAAATGAQAGHGNAHGLGASPSPQGSGSLDAELATPLGTALGVTWLRAAEPVARLATPDDDEALSQQRIRLLQAGVRSRSAPLLFYASKVLLVLLLPLLAWGVMQLSGKPVRTPVLLMALMLAAAVGYYLPRVWLDGRIHRRQRELFDAFPDAIDLMVVCMEAGLGLDLALDRAGRELGLRSPALSEELALMGAEMRLGAPRARALQQMALRTGVEEIRLFVAMLLQADRFGIAVGDSMRVHAQELRVRRQLRAEEAAAKIPLKLLFPLVFTLFPSLLLVLLGPAGIQLVRQFAQAGGG